jgi:hypothetical protein
MRTPSPLPIPFDTVAMSDTKDLQMDGDSKDLGGGVADEVTVTPTDNEMIILANDAHR